MKVLLAAEEGAGLRVLSALTAGGHDVAAVLTTVPEEGAAPSPVFKSATKSGYEIWPAELVKDPAFAESVREHGIDILLNVHSLYLINDAVLQAVRGGAFNLHPGPLPRYAGLNAPSWAIYKGEVEHGVTLHEMTAGIDTGRIVYQTLFPIEETDTGLSLSLRCVTEGVPLVLRLLEEVETAGVDALPFVAQDLELREYFGRKVPNEGRVQWDRPAAEVHNFVRACDYRPFTSPWGQPETRRGDEEVGILRTALTGESCSAAPGTARETEARTCVVACADEWLEVKKVSLAGRTADGIALLADGPTTLA